MFVILKNCNPLDYRGDLVKQECLQKVLECHGQRIHIIKSKKSICDDIVEAGFYGQRYEKYAEDLREYKSELNQFKNSFNYTFTLDFSNEDENNFLIHQDDKKLNIVCSYKVAKLESFHQGAILLGEDETDCEFFDIITSAYARANFGNSVKSHIQYLEGGGSRTHKKYIDMMKNNKFGICIVDNDKKHPESSEGSTSSKFKTHKERGFYQNQESIILDFHEAESIIPESILIDVIDNSKIDDFDNVIRIDEKTEYKFRQYFDHKNGLSLKEAWILDKGREIKFWEKVFKEQHLFNHKPCRTVKSCTNTGNETNCNTCIEINGFGSKILEQSIDKLTRANLRRIRGSLTPYISEQWEFIGESVLNWSCSPNLSKPRAN